MTFHIVRLVLLLRMALSDPRPAAENIGRLFRTRFKGSQFIVVSLKDGLFSNANGETQFSLPLLDVLY